jgi:hypothetical protein
MKKSAKSPAPAAPQPPTAPVFKPPLKPRPGLFYALLGLVGVWVGVLLTLYFVTVYPARHRHVEPDPASVAPTVAR